MRRAYLLLFILPLVIFSASCKRDDGPSTTPEEEQKNRLAHTWNLVSVTLDNADVSSDWTGFSVNFTTSNSYTTSSTSNETVWPAAGTWEFQSNEGSGLNVIIRNDGVQMDVSNLTSTENSGTLTLSFTITTASSARLKGVDGDYVFTLSRQG